MPKSNRSVYRLLRLIMTMALMAVLVTTITTGVTYGWKNLRVITNEFTAVKTTRPPGGGGGDGSGISLNVNKVRIPEEGHPESILVQLYRNGAAYGNPVRLDSGNSWSYRWTGLNRDYTWTVNELNVPDEYTKTISGNISTGFTITNTRKDYTTPPPKPNPGETPDLEKPPDLDDLGDPKIPAGNTDPEPGTPTPGPGTTPVSDKPGNPATPSHSPKTGDDADPRLWLITLAVSAFILRHVLFFRKKQVEKM
jgi:hypothetical protein